MTLPSGCPPDARAQRLAAARPALSGPGALCHASYIQTPRQGSRGWGSGGLPRLGPYARIPQVTETGGREGKENKSPTLQAYLGLPCARRNY